MAEAIESPTPHERLAEARKSLAALGLSGVSEHVLEILEARTELYESDLETELLVVHDVERHLTARAVRELRILGVVRYTGPYRLALAEWVEGILDPARETW